MKKLNYLLIASVFTLLFSCGEGTQEPAIEAPKNVRVEFSATGDYERFDAIIGFTLTKGSQDFRYIKPLVSPDSLVFEYPIDGSFIDGSLYFEPLMEGFTVESSESVDALTFVMISTSRLEGNEDTNYSFTGTFRIFVEEELVESIEHTHQQSELSKSVQYTTSY